METNENTFLITEVFFSSCVPITTKCSSIFKMIILLFVEVTYVTSIGCVKYKNTLTLVMRINILNFHDSTLPSSLDLFSWMNKPIENFT